MDLSQQIPVEAVSLQLFDAEQWEQPPLQAQTDAQGLARITLPTEQQQSGQWTLYAQTADQEFEALTSSYVYGSSQQYRIYTYTDRPLYRPGQTVYFRSILRQQPPGENYRTPPPDLPVYVRIKTPKGDVLEDQQLATSSFGTVHGSFSLPEATDLGSFELEIILPDGSTDYSFVSVEEYRKPEFDVTVTPDHEWIRQGESTHVNISAEYLFGGPVAEAEVHYIVYRSPDWSYRYRVLPPSPEEAFFQSDLQREQYGYYGGYGDVIAEGDAFTDSGGVAQIRLDQVLEDYTWGEADRYFGEPPVQELRIEAQVTDISRRSVTRDGRLRVTQSDLALFVEGDQWIARPGEAASYKLRAFGYDQEPRSLSGSLSLEEWDWNREKRSYRRIRTVLTQPFEVDTGEGEIALRLPSDLTTGDYRINVRARDGHGQVVEDTTHLWISNPRDPATHWSGERSAIEVIADQQVYRIGDTAQLVITSPVPDAYALLTVEGNALYQAEVRQFSGQLLTVDLPIQAIYQPNVYFSVSVVGSQRQLYQGETVIRVSPLDQFLTVELESDRERYQPGETALVTVRTKDAQGNPVSAEVSLGVVDEGIYILRPDSTPDIRRYFFQRRYNRVNTSTSFPQQYPGGQDKLANQLRQDFRDTAAWFPAVTTDPSGEADVEVRLPDNLTTWRLTARAITADTQVGSTQTTLTVTKDLLVRLATPRFFTTGDQLRLTAVIQNQTAQPQEVNVQLEVPSALIPETALTQRIQVPPQGARRVEWPTQVKSAGRINVRVWAEAGDLKDGMQLTLPIQAYGSRFRWQDQGQFTSEQNSTQTLSLTLPDTIVPGSLQGHIQLAVHPAADLLGALDYLVQFPYGCTEQTLSRILPTLAVVEAAARLDLTLQSETLARLPQIMKDGFTQLQRQQNQNGSWGWWRFDQGNPFLTSYVLMGYHRAHAANFAIDLSSEDRGLQYLEEQISQGSLDPDTLMFGEYALSLFGQGNLNPVQSTLPEELSTWGLAYRTLALLRLGDRQAAQISLDAAMKRVTVDKSYHWVQKADGSVNSTRGQWQRFTYDAAEVAAPLLEAATALQDPRAEAIAEWILGHRGSQRWLTTKATADAIVGLTTYYAATATQNPLPQEVWVRNLTTGAVLGRWVPSSTELQRQISLSPMDLNTELLQPGEQMLQIETQGPGTLYYSLSLEAFRPVQAGEQVGGEDQGFQVERQYYTLTPREQGDGTLIYEEQELRGAARAGETLLGRVKVTAARDSNYVMIEEPLPSGAEITSQDPQQLTGRTSRSDYWWNWFWTHQTIRDDRITFSSPICPRANMNLFIYFVPRSQGSFAFLPHMPKRCIVLQKCMGKASVRL
ncbi:MAG: alpha-2-macroglobulin [Synechococcaceae cyanobacterium SM2_3_1]|nr:alpha-2-macroglobulin [Synechococcaceae cyanobacterium SM2_3_1]